MSPTPIFYALALVAAPLIAVTGPEGPDSREIPVPAIASPLGALPGPADLPLRPGLPDLFTANDGSKVTTLGQWSRRREELRRTLAYYAVGRSPPSPGNVAGRELHAESVLGGHVRYRLIRLSFGPKRALSLNIGVFTPETGGPFPAIILQGGTPPGAPVLDRLPRGPTQGRGVDVLLPDSMPTGREPHAGETASAIAMLDTPGTAELVASRYRAVFERGYALVVYNDNDCAEDTTLRRPDGSWAFRSTRFLPAYPGYDWGILAAWAWGASRIADYLDSDSSIDATRLIITGASRAGKSAMIAAAFDDRFMAAPVVTGGGGIGVYRFAGANHTETLDIVETKYPNWFSPHLHTFRGQREKLPFDEHWFPALCAPRPFLALEGDSDPLSLPEAVRRSVDAARAVYSLYGHEDRIAIHYSHHAHAFTDEDWTAMMDFGDAHLGRGGGLPAVEPQGAEACHDLGMALRRGGGDTALEDAVVWLKKAVDLAPGNPGYLADYGGTCLQIADHRQSWTYAVRGRDAMEKALAMDPSLLDCRYGLMKFFAKAPWPLGDPARALAQAGEIAHYNPSRGVQACLALERIFERSGQYSDAKTACTAALGIDPVNRDAKASVARLKAR